MDVYTDPPKSVLEQDFPDCEMTLSMPMLALGEIVWVELKGSAPAVRDLRAWLVEQIRQNDA